MPKKININYEVGDIFSFPLLRKGYGIGVIIKIIGTGIVLGYFFYLFLNKIPLEKEIILHRQEIIFIRKFGDLGLIKGEWRVIGNTTNTQILNEPICGFWRKPDPVYST